MKENVELYLELPSLGFLTHITKKKKLIGLQVTKLEEKDTFLVSRNNMF